MAHPVQAWRRPVSALGHVERTHMTEKVYCASSAETLRPVLWARSVATGKVRDLPALSALADEDLDRAQAWVLRCGSALVM